MYFHLKYFLRPLFIMVVALFFSTQLNATIYYVSSSTGNDLNSGTSSNLPWKTLSKVNSLTPLPGDQILFKRGETWTGTITIKSSGTTSNPITFGAWGDGANPVITGFTTVTGWVNEGNGIYSKVLSAESNPEIATINGVQYAMGRTPNSDRNNPKYSDFYHIDSFSGTTSITDSECNSSITDWDGAEIVVKNSSQIQWSRYQITNHTGTTLTYLNPDNNSNAVGYGYFIQNSLKTLDRFGEWYYGNGKFYMYFGTTVPTNYTVKVSTVDNFFEVGGRDFISIKNFRFEGANNNAIETNYGANAYNLTVEYCDFDLNNRGIYGHMAFEMTVKNCSFKRSTYMAIYNHWYSDGAYFGYNTIDSTGLIIGAGPTDFYTGISVLISYSKHTYSQKNTTIEHNTITNSGFVGINFSGDNAVVKYNFIDTYCINKSDGGGIYYGNRTDLSNMTIDHNIVLNGIQNNEADGLPLDMVSNKQYNIYLDYYSTEGFTITNNTTAFSQGGAGIMLHGSQNVIIRNNTVYDCAVGIRLQELDGLGYPSRNVTMDNNIVLAKTLSQVCVLARSTTYDFNQYGTFTNNYYAKPINNTNSFATLLNTWTNTYHNFSGWKTYTSLDASSNMSNQTISNVNELQFEYNSTESQQTVSLSQPMIDAKGIKYSTSITLQPFSSAVLMKDKNPVISDLTKPVITVFTIPEYSNTLVIPVNNFTVVSKQTVTGYKLTESSNTPLASDAGWTSVIPTSYTFSSLGVKTLYAWAKDAAGNVSPSASAQIVIQKNLGYTEVYTTTTTSTSRSAMPVTVTEAGELHSISIYHNGGTGNLILGVYSDVNGFPSTRLGVTSSTTINSIAGWQTVTLSSPVPVVSGQKVWLSWVFQNNPGIRYVSGTPGRAASSGYWASGMPTSFGTSTISNIKLSIYCNYLPENALPDVTKPVVTAFSIPSTSSTLTVSINSLTATDNKGVTGYILTESATAPLASSSGWTATAPTSYSFSGEGTKTLYAWAKDAAGNISSRVGAQVIITLPVNNEVIIGNTDVYSNISNLGNLMAMPLTFTEDGDIKSISIYHNGGTGNMILGVYSDVAGYPTSRLGITASTAINTTAGWQTIELINSVPVLSGQKIWLSWLFQSNPGIRYITGTPGRASSSLTWSSGMPATFGTSSISNSKYSVYCTYTSPNNPIDVTAPIVNTFNIPATSSTFTVQVNNFTATDNKGVTGYILTETSVAPLTTASGWSSSTPASYTFSTEGTKTLYAWAKDDAGNVSSSISAQVSITLPVYSTGNTDVYTSTSTLTNLMAMPVTFTENGLVKSIAIYHNGGSGNVILGVYSDQGGLPSARLGVTASTAINSTAGWQTIQLTSNISVSQDQKVWLSWVFQNNPGIRYVSGTPGRASSSNTWTNGMPLTFGTSSISNSKYSIYCNYTSQTSSNDITAPIVNTFSIPPTSNSLTVSVINFTASDNNGVTGYLLTESSNTPLAIDAGWSSSAPATYIFSSEGTKTLYAWAKDAAGNISTNLSGQVTITLPDVTKPVVNAFSVPATSSIYNVPVNNFTAFDNKGVTGYLITESSAEPLLNNAAWSSVVPTSYVFSSEGTKTLYAWAKDAAGNISLSLNAQVIVTLPIYSFGNTEVYTNISSLGNLMAMPFSFTDSGEIKSISIYHEGGNGNLILGVYSDLDGYPSTRLGITASTVINSTAGWQTIQLISPVSVIVGQKIWLSWVFQNNPGIHYISGTPGRASSTSTWSGGMPATFGTSTISNSKYSIFCNYSTQNNPTDNTTPVVNSFNIPSTSSTLTVPINSFTASDNILVTGYLISETSNPPLEGDSRWSTNVPVSYIFSTEGTKTIYAWAKDAAGNISSSLNAQVSITLPDVTKPIVTSFSIPSVSSSLNVLVNSFTTSDNKGVTGYILTESSTAPLASNSGWSASAPTSYTFATEGTKILYAWAKDAAGNVSANASAQVVITLPLVILGNTDVFTIVSTLGNLMAMPFTFTETGEVKSISIYHNGGTGNVLLGVYSDQGGYPSTRLGITTSTLVNSAEGWQTVPLTSSVPVVSGQKIWLSWVFQNNPGVRYSLGTPGRASSSSNTWTNGMPAAFGTSTISNSKYSIYCNYISQNNMIDLTAPVVDIFNIPVTSNTLNVAISSFNASDNINVTGYLITESANAPLINDTGWSSNIPTSYTFTTEGTKTLYAWAKDAAGNISASLSAQVIITLPDITKPDVTLFSIPASSSSLIVSISGFTATDNRGVTGYLITETLSAPLASNSGWSSFAPASYTFTSEGTKTLYAWAKDAAGNVSTGLSAQVIITLPDVVKPVVTAFTIPSTSTSLVISVSSVTATDNKSVTGYLLTETATTPLSSNPGWSTSAPTSYTFSNEGTKTLYAWAKDAAGNISNALSAQVTITLPDVTKPVIASFSISASSSSLIVPITAFSATDNRGVTGYLITETSTTPLTDNPNWSASAPGSYSFLSEGTKTLYAWVKDAAGNISSSLSAQVLITLPIYAVGNTEIYSTVTYLGNLMAMPLTLTETGEIKSISIYHEGGTGNFLLGVYSNLDGYPSNRLGVTASTTINSTAGWQTVQLSSPVAITSGQTIWLSWVFQTNPGIRYTSGTPGRAASIYTWANGMPASFGSSNIVNNIYSVYCTFSSQNNPNDITDPVVNSFSIPATSTSLTIPISSFTASDNRAVTGYLITESATPPLPANTGWSSSIPVNYTFASEGTKTLYAWVKDAAGNVSIGLSDQVIITLPDITKPVVTSFFIVPATSSSLVISVTNFTATDNKSVTGYLITETSTPPLPGDAEWSASAPVTFTFNSDGNKTLYAWAKDGAGNVSLSLNTAINITLPLFSAGNTDVYGNTIAWVNQLAMPVTFTESGEIKSIAIYHEGGTGNLLLGVYSDLDGYPSARLGITVSTPINSTAGWQTIQLTSNVPVVSGQKVWLSWVFQNNPGIRYTTGSPGRAASTNTWTNGMPSNFGTSTIASTLYSIYCNYVVIPDQLKDAIVSDSNSKNYSEIVFENSINKGEKIIPVENIVPETNEMNFVIYPNPAFSIVHIDFPGFVEFETKIFIIDNIGRTVITRNMESPSEIIDINKLSGGTYYVKLVNRVKTISKKLIIGKN